MKRPLIVMHDFGKDNPSKYTFTYANKHTSESTEGFIKAIHRSWPEEGSDYYLVPNTDKTTQKKINLDDYYYTVKVNYQNIKWGLYLNY